MRGHKCGYMVKSTRTAAAQTLDRHPIDHQARQLDKRDMLIAGFAALYAPPTTMVAIFVISARCWHQKGRTPVYPVQNASVWLACKGYGNHQN